MKKNWSLASFMLFALLLFPLQTIAQDANPLNVWNNQYMSTSDEGIVFFFGSPGQYSEGGGGYFFDYRIEYNGDVVYKGSAFIQSQEEDELSKPLKAKSPLFKATCNQGHFNFTINPSIPHEGDPFDLYVTEGSDAKNSLLNVKKIIGFFKSAAG